MRTVDALLEQHRVIDPPEGFRGYALGENESVYDTAKVVARIPRLLTVGREE